MAETFTLADVQSKPETFTLASLREKPLGEKALDFAANAAGGILKGASQIGTTLLMPADAIARGVGIQNDFIGRNDRRQTVDQFMDSNGVDRNSLAYGGFKLGTEIAGTSGAGGLVAKGLSFLPGVAKAAPLIEAISSSGLKAGGAGLGTRMAGGAINGALQAGLVDPADAGMGAAVGGALPAVTKGMGWAGGKLGASLNGGGMSPEVKTLAQRAQELGIDIPADRLVNSKPLNAVASSLNYIPMSGRAGTEAKMVSQMNRAVSRTFGQDSENVTQALRRASDALGGEFDRVLKGTNVGIDQQFLTDLAERANQATAELGKDQAGIILNQIDEIIRKGGNGAIDGQTAYNIKKTLDRIGARNSPEAWYANDLKKSLMGALNRSLGADEAAAFAKTRQQYGTMLDLEKLAQNGAEGEISVARLANMKNIKNPSLQELADISAQFLKGREGQHGAAQRVALSALSIPTVYTGMASVPALAAGVATGRALNKGLNSGTARGLLMDGVPEIPLGGLLSQGVYRSAPVISAQ